MKVAGRTAARREEAGKAETSRAAILEAAARLFRDHGYGATTLRGIADAAGMKAGSIYYHFASKDEILDEVLDLGIEVIHRGVVEAIDALPPGASAMRRIDTAIRTHLEVLLRYGDYTSANIRIYGQVPDAAKQRNMPVRQAYADYWTKLLDDARREGVVRDDISLKMLRLLLVGSMNWTVEWYRNERGGVEGIAEAVRKLFFEGTLTPRARAQFEAEMASMSTDRRRGARKGGQGVAKGGQAAAKEGRGAGAVRRRADAARQVQ